MFRPRTSIVAVATALLLGTALPPANAATGDSHLLVANSAGGLVQTTRTSGGTWSAFSPIGVPGSAVSAAEATLNGQRNLIALTTSGLYRSVLTTDGWSAFTDISAAGAGAPDTQTGLGNGGVKPGRISATVAGGVLHVVLTALGQATHTSMRADGSWVPFNAGPLAAFQGYIRNADVVGLPNGELHLAISHFQGNVYHSIIYPSGAFTPLAQANGAVYIPDGFVATAAVGDQVHVLALTNARRLFDSIRYPNGSWSGFVDVSGQTGLVVNGMITAVGDANGQVQVTAGAGYVGTPLYHTVRTAAGPWTAFTPVYDQAGNPGGSALGIDLGTE